MLSCRGFLAFPSGLVPSERHGTGPRKVSNPLEALNSRETEVERVCQAPTKALEYDFPVLVSTRQKSFVHDVYFIWVP